MDLFESRSAQPMLIAQQREAFDDPEWIYELKMDGFRCLCYAKDGMVDLRNKRNMQMNSRFPELMPIYKNIKGTSIQDGEIVVLVNGVPDFYRLQKRTLLTDRFKIELEASRYPASFVAFDCIYCDGKELIWNPLMQRKEVLKDLITESPRIAVARYVENNGRALYKAAEQKLLEGVVAKKKDSPYLMGKRTKDWIKFKRMTDEEFVVTGYIQKAQHIFSLIIAKYRGDILIYKGHVTSGVTKDVVSMLDITGINPFRMLPTGNEAAIWVKTNRVCVVAYMPSTMDSLRQPIFKGFRDDVFPEEVQIE